MDFWNECPDDVLIAIFKNFDLLTRLKAGQTCKRWYELLNDPITNMEDVSNIYLWNQYDNSFLVSLAHIGESESLYISVKDLTILPQISAMINDGRLKIDNLLVLNGDADFTMTECLNTILPSSINGLNISANNDQFQFILDCDWFQLPRLQRLTLHNLLIDPQPNSLPLLKYLNWSFRVHDKEANDLALEAFIQILPLFSTLEELEIRTNFVDVSFRNLLHTIKNDLPNLRRLYFENIDFQLSNVHSIMKEFLAFPLSSSLKEIGFIYCDGEWIDAARLFLHVCSLEIIYINFRFFKTTAMEQIYGLTPLMKKKGAKFEFDCHGNGDFDLVKIPTELCSTLSNLRIDGTKSLEFLLRFFGCGSFEKLTELILECDALNGDVLKIILQNCPFLKKLQIVDCNRIIGDDLKLFFDYWEKRKSKQLSVEFINESSGGDGLFDGTSFDQDRGIFEDGKRWKMYRKLDLENYYTSKRRTRLVIWDQGNSVDDVNQKVLIIKDYGRYWFNKNPLNKRFEL